MPYPAAVSVLGCGSEGWHCGWGQRIGKFGKFSHSGRVTGKFCVDDLCVHSCKYGSVDFCGCVVDGMIARAAS